jgi:tetratricopeptide (TPR) repeat protein
MLKHSVFFEALATLAGNTPEWEATAAGLVTMRLVDRWIQGMADGTVPSAEAVRPVRRAVTKLDRHHPLRGALDALSCAVSGSQHPPPPGLDPRTCLLAYARALHGQAQWGLAADVYLTFVCLARSPDDVQARADACLRIGACRRMMGQLAGASAAYQEAAALAAESGDARAALLSRIGEANVMLQRGELTAAEAALERVRADARTPELRDVLARATHDLGGVIFHRATADPVGDGRLDRTGLERSAVLFSDARQLYAESERRDRALADLAAALIMLGYSGAARDALETLVRTATEVETRWSATVNLLELATRDADEALFNVYAGELAGVALPAALAARYHLNVGHAARRFGRRDEALASYQQAYKLAEANGVPEIYVMAKAAIQAVKQHHPLADDTRPPSLEPPLTLAPVIRHLGDLRASV